MWLGVREAREVSQFVVLPKGLYPREEITSRLLDAIPSCQFIGNILDNFAACNTLIARTVDARC